MRGGAERGKRWEAVEQQEDSGKEGGKEQGRIIHNETNRGDELWGRNEQGG